MSEFVKCIFDVLYRQRTKQDWIIGSVRPEMTLGFLLGPETRWQYDVVDVEILAIFASNQRCYFLFLEHCFNHAIISISNNAGV
jgi:hypothetical protein